MKNITSGQNLKIILGIKVKSFRDQLGYSLQELSTKSGIAVSYLSEIESGKKYPKPEKILQLAAALDVDFDVLVSAKVDKRLNPFAALLNTDLLKQFPFHLFGLSTGDILGLFKNSPEDAHAFLQTFLQISRAYDMTLENFLFAALRTYIKQQNNYFADLEEKAEEWLANSTFSGKTGGYEELAEILQDLYGYTIEESGLAEHPVLKSLRSVLRQEKTLSINSELLPSQKRFILAKEIGFVELGIKERPQTSSWIKVESFNQLVNNFKASYFAGAMLLRREETKADLVRFFNKDHWDGASFTGLLHDHQATPEMLMYRMSQLLPGVFGLKNIFYFRFINTSERTAIMLTKELNMTDTLLSYGLGVNEHHCRRLVPVRLLRKLHHGKVMRAEGVQKVEFVKSGERFLVLSMARPLSLSKSRGSAIGLGIRIDKDSEKVINFIDDPRIVPEQVSESCERCPLKDCSERVVEASLIGKQHYNEKREEALDEFISKK